MSVKKKRVETEISEILHVLESTEVVRSMTVELVKIADQYGVLGSNNTLGESAGLVYIAGILARAPHTLDAIAEKAGISPKTVRKYKTHLASELKTKKEWPSLSSKGR